MAWVLIALLAAVSLHAQVRLSGRVVDENGVAVEGARVEVGGGIAVLVKDAVAAGEERLP